MQRVSESVFQFYICAKRFNTMLFPVHKIADKFAKQRPCSQHVLIYNRIVNEKNLFFMFFTDSSTVINQEITNFIFTSKTFKKDFEFFESINISEFSCMFDLVKKNKNLDEIINLDEKNVLNLKINFEKNHFYTDPSVFRICDQYLSIGLHQDIYFKPSEKSFHFSNQILNSFKYLKDRKICIRSFIRINTEQTVSVLKTFDDFPEIKIMFIGFTTGNFEWC